MGEAAKHKLGINFRIIIGTMIALSSIFPTFSDTLFEIIKIIKIVKPPNPSMTLSDISAIFIDSMSRFFIVFAVAGLVGGMLFAPNFGHPDLRGWMTALRFFVLCQLFGFMGQVTIGSISLGLWAIIAGVFVGPRFAFEEQFRSPTSVLVWLICFMLTQFIATRLRKKLHVNLN